MKENVRKRILWEPVHCLWVRSPWIPSGVFFLPISRLKFVLWCHVKWMHYCQNLQKQRSREIYFYTEELSVQLLTQVGTKISITRFSCRSMKNGRYSFKRKSIWKIYSKVIMWAERRCSNNLGITLTWLFLQYWRHSFVLSECLYKIKGETKLWTRREA